MVYLVVLIVAAVAWFLKRTRGGLVLRAVGDNHDSAHALGYPVLRVRLLAVLFGGMMAGLGGAYLPLMLTPHWAEGMTAGRGWIALALVVVCQLDAVAGSRRRADFWRNHHHAACRTGARMDGSITVSLDAALCGDDPRPCADFEKQRIRIGEFPGLSGAGLPRRQIETWSDNDNNTAEECKMKKLLSMLAAGAVATAAMVTAAIADPVKVGFVYLTNPGDHGWTYAHEVGRQDVEKHFGDKVETTFVENVPEGPDSTRVIRELARQGNKMIFTTSFGYMDPTLKVAKGIPGCEIRPSDRLQAVVEHGDRQHPVL